MEFVCTIIPIFGMMFLALSSFYVARRGQFKISKRVNRKLTSSSLVAQPIVSKSRCLTSADRYQKVRNFRHLLKLYGNCKTVQ